MATRKNEIPLNHDGVSVNKANRNTLIVFIISLLVTCSILALVASRYGILLINLPLASKRAFYEDTVDHPDRLRDVTNGFIDEIGSTLILD